MENRKEKVRVEVTHGGRIWGVADQMAPICIYDALGEVALIGEGLRSLQCVLEAVNSPYFQGVEYIGDAAEKIQNGVISECLSLCEAVTDKIRETFPGDEELAKPVNLF